MARRARDLGASDGGATRAARSRLRLALERLGGKRLLGVEVRAEADFLKVLERGVPVSALAELTRQEALSPDDVDRLIIPVQPLDILAQQIVASCAAEDWNEDELFALARRACDASSAR